MAQVVWLPESLGDVERLHTFLYDKDVDAAAHAAEIILRGSKLIANNVRIGRPMPDETGRRELFTAFGAGAYVLRYMIDSSRNVVIIRVWHSREHR